MRTTRRAIIAGSAAAVLLFGASGAAVAGGPGGFGDRPGGDQDANGAGPSAGAGPMRQGDGTGSGWMGGRGTGQRGSGDCTTADPNVELSDTQAATLLHMREEEQLAHDLYVALDEQWDNSVFTRIAASESRHIQAVQNLLDRYGLTDPSPGEGFDDDGLQALWDELLAKGLTSESAALEVGRTVEKADVADLTKALADGQPADVTRVYQHLLAGSQRHLAAFGG